MTSNQILIGVIGLFFITTGLIYIVHLKSQVNKTKRESTVAYSLMIFGFIIFSLPFLGIITSGSNERPVQNNKKESSLMGEDAFTKGNEIIYSDPENDKNHEEASKNYEKGASLWSAEMGAYDSASIAMEYFDRSILLFETAEALTARGQLKVQFSKMNEAMADYERAIEIKPDFGNAYFNRAALYYIYGDTQKACDDWRKANEFGVPQAIEVLSSMCN